MSAARPALSPVRALAPAIAAVAAALVPVGLLVAQRLAPPPAPAATRMVAATLAGRALEFDERLIARGPQESGARADRLDILAGWPEFGPPRLVARDADGRFAAPGPEANILISLQPADATIDPAERTIAVYSRFLERDIWSNPGGLVARRFRAGSPYEGEELVQTSEGREFAARCPGASTAPTSPPMRCIFMFRLAGLDATVSFDPALLPEWARLRSGALEMVGRALR